MKRIFNIWLILICLTCLPGNLWAQAKVMIRGVVTSGTDGSTLPGANVQLVNKDSRVMAFSVTDIDGNYSLMSDLSSGDQLIVTYSGFKKQTIKIKDVTASPFNVVLQENVVQLSGAMVVAKRQISNGMMNIAERDLTSSAQRISMADLEDVAGASVDDALQGRIAGADIVANSGTPGAGMSIRIRGTSSINGNSEPLIVVDGFPYETTISSDFDFANADEQQYSQMLNIAPSDIKDITVLKDAAATAIWGSKAANGVLQITTKRGAISKPRVTYTVKGSIDRQGRGIPTLNGDEYKTVIQDELMNSGNPFDPNTYPELASDPNNLYNYYNYGANTDWFKEVTQTGYVQDHSLSISGGGEKAQYRASVGYYDQTGTVIGTDFSRISTRLNVDYNVSTKLKFQASMSYTHSLNNRCYITYLNSKKDVTEMAYTRAPNMSVYEYNEQGQLTDNYFTPLTSLQGSWSSSSLSGVYNPVAMAREGKYKLISDRIIPELSLIWTPWSWVRYTFDVGFDVMNDKTNAFLPQTATGRPWTELSVNKADDYDSEAFIMQFFNKLILTPNIGKFHTLQILLGTQTYDKKSSYYNSSTSNSASPYLTDPSVSSRIIEQSKLGIYSGSSETRLVSAYTQWQYSLLDRYLLNFTARYDGNSRFGKDYRWGFFPSVSTRWRISGEPFMKWANKWLNELSLRASYGVNGNEPTSDYVSVSTYSLYSYSYLGETGISPSNLELSKLKWERGTQLNFGLNFSAFDNRFTVDAEYYHKRTNDLFFKNLSIPSTTGFSTVAYMNVGTMDNNGWELSVGITPIRQKDMVFSFNLNLARNENKIQKISDLVSNESGSWNSRGMIRKWVEGQPLGSFYGYQSQGVYLNQDQTIARDANGDKIYTYDESGNAQAVQMKFGYPSLDYEFQPGDAKYKDQNHDGNINSLDIVYLGNASPLLTGGFGPNFRYKQISMNAYFNFRYGNKIYNYAKWNMERMYSFDNQSTAVLRRWKHSYEDATTAPSNLLPRALYSSGYNDMGSDRYIENGSFLRWKSLTLKYTFTRSQLKRTFIQDANIYVTLQNLYCWTKYTGQDPEVSITTSPSTDTSGYDYATSPRTKEYTLGISLTF
jgi:TonB-linked SusC/RagA family outer membrane protein